GESPRAALHRWSAWRTRRRPPGQGADAVAARGAECAAREARAASRAPRGAASRWAASRRTASRGAAMSLGVLHVAQPCGGGVAAYVTAACTDQLRRGWNVAVACPDDGRLPRDLADLGVPHLAWPATRGPGPSILDEVRRLGHLV